MFNIIKNYYTLYLSKFRIYKSKSGATHSDLTKKASIQYIFNVFNDYLNYGGINKKILEGKEILEIGTGDNLGVALLFLVKGGAKKVTCIDKFYSFKNIYQQIEIYKGIRNNLNDNEKKIFDNCIDINKRKINLNKEKILYSQGKGIDELSLLDESFDLIVSRAVLEHVHKIEKVFQVMHRVLKPGGYMLHKVDLRDHGIFSSSGMHPLTFLTIHPRIWRMMSRHCGKPNRKRINFYRNILKSFYYNSKVWITHLLGDKNEFYPHRITINQYPENTMELIKKISRKFSSEYRNLSNEELAIQGIFIVARKKN